MSSLEQARRQLADSIQKSLYEWCDGQALVEEREKDGKAQVTCVLPPGARCIQWRIEAQTLFPFLKERMAADGALLLLLANGQWEAHIMECKLTVNQDAWARAKRQMRWSLVRLRALAGVMNVRLDRVVCYTAYREDALEPGLLKLPIGVLQPENEEQAEDLETLREQVDWRDLEIKLRGFDGSFAHHKVQLDTQDGSGRVELR